MADYDRNGKRDTLLGFYNWLTDIHPKSWDQWRHQQVTKGFLPWYGDWMESRSIDERNSHTRDLFNVDISSITYPWLSDVMSNHSDSASVGAVRSMWSFSKNVGSLYFSGGTPRKRSKRRTRRVRRY